MKVLLSGLSPAGGEDSHSEDEKATEYIGRKVSLHTVNVVGTNFEKYHDLRPSQEIKLKILNFFMEFNESFDKTHAVAEFKDIIQTTKVEPFIFLGQMLKNAFSHDEAGWGRIQSLVIDHFYLSEKLFTSEDLTESVNVAMVNFSDMIIDYPNAKEYAFGLFDKLNELGMLSGEMLTKYKQHVVQLEEMGYDYE